MANSALENSAKPALKQGPAATLPETQPVFYRPGQFIALAKDLARSNGFLLTEFGLQIVERWNRVVPVTLPVSRTLAIGTVAADLASAYQVLHQRARWFPWLVEPGDWEMQHKIGADRLVDMAASLGGALIKAGQFASTRPDLLPPVYIERLATLQDQVPPQPWSVIQARLVQELGQPLDRVFARVDPEPVASASLSQVHRAWLKDGRPVALKVQYPQIQELIKADLDMLDLVTQAVALFSAERLLSSIGDYLRETLLFEIDLEHEAAMMGEMREALANRTDVVIPRTYPELSTKRLLVMDFIEGIKITDIEGLHAANINLADITRILVEVYADQVFHHHLLHGDPHPGNLLVQPGPRLVILDHGLTVRIKPALADAMAGVVRALNRNDFAALGVELEAAGLKMRGGADIFTLLQAVSLIFGGAGNIKVTTRLGAKLDKVPVDLLVLGRTLGILNGITLQLDPRQSALATVTRYI